MYSWYQQLHPPTGVEHSVYCNFTSDLKKDLIVVAASQLTVYHLNKNVSVGLCRVLLCSVQLNEIFLTFVGLFNE